MHNYIPIYEHILIALLVTFISIYFLNKNKSNFIPIILLVNIFGNAPQVHGYYFYDEYLTIFVSLYFLFLSIKEKGVSLLIEDIRKIPYLDIILVSLFAIYMIFQSVVGINETNDFRVVRWVVFFFGLVLLYFSILISLLDLYLIKVKAIRIIFWGIIVYLVLYITIGIIFEIYYISRFNSQNYLIAGTSYFFFPVLLGYYLSYHFLDSRSIGFTNPVYIFFFIVVISSMLFDSRLLQVSSLIWVFSFLLSHDFKKFIKLILTYIVVVAMYIGLEEVVPLYIATNSPIHEIEHLSEEQLMTKRTQELWDQDYMHVIKNSLNEVVGNYSTYLENNIVGSLFVFFVPTSSDMTRSMQTQATLKILEDGSLYNLFFGNGFYMHRSLLADYMNKIYDENLSKLLALEKASHLEESRSDLGVKLEIFRTNSINAYIIDSGIIGIFLLLLLLLKSLLSVIKSGVSYRYNKAIIILLAFVWMAFSNITDIYLLYIFIIPGLISSIDSSLLIQKKK